MPKINFLRQKNVTCSEGADKQTDRQTDRDSKYRRTYRIFLVIFFLDFFIDERSKKKQARRTAMDRSNIDNSWNREKLVLAAVYRSLAGKINQNSHSQIIISIDIYQSVPHGINQLQRESWKVTSLCLFILRRRRSECFLLFVNTWNVHKHTDA